jgi:hypothetical protein
MDRLQLQVVHQVVAVVAAVAVVVLVLTQEVLVEEVLRPYKMPTAVAMHE